MDEPCGSGLTKEELRAISARQSGNADKVTQDDNSYIYTEHAYARPKVIKRETKLELCELLKSMPCSKCFHVIKTQTNRHPNDLVNKILEVQVHPHHFIATNAVSTIHNEILVWKIFFTYTSTNGSFLHLLDGCMIPTTVINPMLIEDILKEFPHLHNSVWKGYRTANTNDGDAANLVETGFQITNHDECKLTEWIRLATEFTTTNLNE